MHKNSEITFLQGLGVLSIEYSATCKPKGKQSFNGFPSTILTPLVINIKHTKQPQDPTMLDLPRLIGSFYVLDTTKLAHYL